MTISLPGVQLYVDDGAGGLLPVTEAMLQGNGTVTPIDLTGGTVTEYPTQAALLTATPIADEIGYVALASTDGHRGKAYAWDLATGRWTILTAVSSVNGQTGIVVIRADNIEETATRKWLSDVERQQLSSAVGAIATIQQEQTAQDARAATIEATNTNQDAAIALLRTDVAALTGGGSTLGDRMTTAEGDIDTLQTVTGNHGATLNLLTSGQTVQDGRLDTVEATNTTQTLQITTLQTTQATTTARLNGIDTTNVAQDTAAAALAARVATAEGEVNALEAGQLIQDAAATALTGRVTAAEGEIDTLQTTQATLSSTVAGFSAIYQVRSEKNQPGGYVALRDNGTIDPNFLPFDSSVFKEISPAATIAERDALAANDTRPEVNGPWGLAQTGFAVAVADTGAGAAGFFIWNGTGFDDYSNSFSIASTTDLPEGTNLYYTDARVAASPAVSANTGDIAALEAGQTAQDGQITTLQSTLSTNAGRLTNTEIATAANTANIATNTSGIAANVAAIAALGDDFLNKGGDAPVSALVAGTTNAQDFNLITGNTTRISLKAAGGITFLGLAEEPAAGRFAMIDPVTGALSYRNIAAFTNTFNGRSGAVVPVAGDYGSDEITNDSGVAGASVTAALNQLDADIAAVTTDYVTKGGDTDAAPLIIGTNDAQPLTLETANTPRIVLGAAGEVAIAGLTDNVAATETLRRDPGTGRIYATALAALSGWMNGLQITWNSGSSISVGVGQAEIGGALVNLSSAMTKTTAAWVAGSGNGGVIGAFANGGLWVYIGYNGSAVDVFLSASSAEITHSGYTLRLIGALWVAASNVVNFYNDSPGKFEYKPPVGELYAPFAANTTQIHTLSVPSHANKITAELTVTIIGASTEHRFAMGRVSQNVVWNSDWAKSGVLGGAGLLVTQGFSCVAEDRQIKQVIPPANDQTLVIITSGYHVNLQP